MTGAGQPFAGAPDESLRIDEDGCIRLALLGALIAMGNNDIQIAICGSAGDGTIAAGDILKRTMARCGYKVIAFDLYPAEIRGFGKCIARVRISTEQAYSLKHQSDVLVSLHDSDAIAHVMRSATSAR